jgi:hypothetical protein
VKIGTYYRGFRRAYRLPKLKKICVRERENKKLSLKKRECEQQKERWRIFFKNLKKLDRKKKLERERNSKEEGEEE